MSADDTVPDDAVGTDEDTTEVPRPETGSADGSGDADARARTTPRDEGDSRAPGITDAPFEEGAEMPSLRDHPLAALVGSVAILLGLGAAVGLDLVPTLDNAGGMVTTVVLGVLLVGVWLATRQFFATVSQAETRDVEYHGSIRVPGAEYDDLLHEATAALGTRRATARGELLSRVRETAVTLVGAADGVSPDAARERIEDGTWTDDAEAAALLADQGPTVSVTDQIRAATGRPSRFGVALDRTVAELATLVSGVDAAAREAPGDTRPEAADTRAEERVRRDRRTGRWTGLAGVGLLTVGVGLYASWSTTEPSLVVAAAAVVGAAGYVFLSSAPDPDVRVKRTLEPAGAAPDETVTVTLSVTNVGDALLPDLRVVDGVPDGLVVADGSPRAASALRPGESLTVSYAVTAVRGRHVFDPVQVIARDASGAVERERHVRSGEPTVLTCELELVADESIPVHSQTAQRVGRVATDSGGSGVELHSVREYRRGDPLNRIDWNRVASTGEFATQQFREEHAATVVLLVDASAPAHVAPRADARSAIEWELDAADTVLASLITDGDAVGLTALAPAECWLPPRGGKGQQARARNLLETDPIFDGRRPEGDIYEDIEARRLRRELPADAQLVVFSPLCDDTVASLARRLHAHGYPVTVISPDVTGSATVGQRLATVERAERISRLRRATVRVVDWDTDRPLAAALAAAERRWSA